MKQIKIKQEFLNYIKDGIKTFEIRKDPNLDGVVKLVVLDLDIKISDLNKYCYLCREVHSEKDTIKDEILVKMIKREFSVFEIIQNLYESKIDYFPMNHEHFNMFVETIEFIKNYIKNNEIIY